MNSQHSALFDLDGEVAIVTGAMGKLGPVWIEALLGAGACVAALDLPGAKRSDACAALQGRYDQRRLRFYEADVRERAQLEAARARSAEDLGLATILVNNAGLDHPPGPARSYRVEDVPAQQFSDVFNVNATGAFQAAQVFGAAMCEAGRGSIINIGSLYASVSPDARYYDHLDIDPPFLKPPAYGASKAALVNLTRYLATHWARHGVRVNALSPGGVLGGQDAAFKQKFCARVPLGRMAESADLSGPLVFLASRAASYVTGIELRVDGGYTAW